MTPSPDELVERLRKASEFLPADYATICDEAADLITALTAPQPGLEPSLHELTVSDARRLAHEINEDVMAGEDEIAEAIEAGFQFREQRLRADNATLTARLAAAEAAKAQDGAEIIKLWREREEARAGMEREARGHLKARTARETAEAALREARAYIRAEPGSPKRVDEIVARIDAALTTPTPAEEDKP